MTTTRRHRRTRASLPARHRLLLLALALSGCADSESDERSVRHGPATAGGAVDATQAPTDHERFADRSISAAQNTSVASASVSPPDPRPATVRAGQAPAYDPDYDDGVAVSDERTEDPAQLIIANVHWTFHYNPTKSAEVAFPIGVQGYLYADCVHSSDPNSKPFNCNQYVIFRSKNRARLKTTYDQQGVDYALHSFRLKPRSRFTTYQEPGDVTVQAEVYLDGRTGSTKDVTLTVLPAPTTFTADTLKFTHMSRYQPLKWGGLLDLVIQDQGSGWNVVASAIRSKLSAARPVFVSSAPSAIQIWADSAQYAVMGPGRSTVTATFLGQQAIADITVLEPTSITARAGGNSLPLYAPPCDQLRPDDRMAPDIQVFGTYAAPGASPFEYGVPIARWSSSDAAVIKPSADEKSLEAVGPGTANVRAMYGKLTTAPVPVKVLPAGKISITADAAPLMRGLQTVGIGATTRFPADIFRARCANGFTPSVTVTASSSNPAGLATTIAGQNVIMSGLAPGSYGITLTGRAGNATTSFAFGVIVR